MRGQAGCATWLSCSEMTNSPTTETARRPGKRERLVAAAKQMVYEQGVERTTLADVAAAADVPPGNVYYYFKTKDDLVEAAIASHAEDVRATLASLEKHRTPKARLRALIRMLTEQRDQVSELGCPQGSLCSELDKRGDRLSEASGAMMRLPVEWAQRQFEEMGRRDAAELAIALISSYQGVALLTNAFREPEVMAREGRRLERWIDGLHASR
jgi:TetR/AcrR family transcriptional regulator, transcriptional repressor for nem operon